MKCTLIGGNTRVFAKAVQSLSKFGCDLFLEAEQDQMRLRCLNPTRSAIGSICFNRDFFEHYQVNRGAEVYCKISMKVCLAVFRNTRQVERCAMHFSDSKLEVQLKCRLETIKNAVIPIVDEENITADVPVDNVRNRIRGSHNIFSEISNYFNTSEEELTLEVESKQLVAKNYVEGSRVNEKFMRSQLKLTSNEFEIYDVKNETSITFCLKEFRAFLLFAETLNEFLLLEFDEPGSPVFVKIVCGEIECLLIMSTLCPDDVSFHNELRHSEIMEESMSHTVSKRKAKDSSAKVPKPPKTRRCLPDDTTLSNDSSLFQFNNSSSNCPSVGVARNHEARNPAGNVPSDELFTLSLNNELPQPVAAVNIKKPSEAQVLFCDTEEQEANDNIPQSPQREQGTQLRAIFSRCFEATYVPKEPTGSSEIYVPDSDPES